MNIPVKIDITNTAYRDSFYGYIYLIRDLKNAKLYIGKKTYCKSHERYYGSGVIITLALKKCIADNGTLVGFFSKRVLSYASNAEELNELEVNYIREYSDKFGNSTLYNLSEGGEGFLKGGYNPMHNPECKASFSRASAVARRVNGTNEKHGRYMKALFKNEPNRRLEHSEKLLKLYAERPELKKKISDTQTKRFEENPELRKICSERVKNSHKKDPELRNRQSLSRKKLLSDNPEYLLDVLRLQKLATACAVEARSKAVVRYCTNGTFIWFKSAKVASLQDGTSQNIISKICRGVRIDPCKGYYWRYATQEESEQFKGMLTGELRP